MLAEERERYFSTWTGNAAFTVPAGETWLIQSLTKRIHTVGTATELNIILRNTIGTQYAHLHRDASPSVESVASKLTNFDGAIMKAFDEVFLDPASGSGTLVEIVISRLVVT